MTSKKTFLSFVQQVKTPFLFLNVSWDSEKKKKDYNNSFIKGYDRLTYKEAKAIARECKYEPNQLLHKVPENVVLLDTDTPESYKIVKEYLKKNDLYNKSNITKSYQGRVFDLSYKRHFFFKCEPSNLGKKQFTGLDIFNNSWGVGDWADTYINFDELQELSETHINEIIKLFSKNKNPIVEQKEEKSIIKIESNNIEDKKIIDILEHLNKDRFDVYENWLKLYFMFVNEKWNLDIFHNYCKTCNNYDEENNNKLLKNIEEKNDGITKRTLYIWLQEDDPKYYKLITYTENTRNESLKNTKTDNLNIDFEETLTTRSIATHFKKLFGDIFIFQDSKLYYYNGVYWKAEGVKEKLVHINNFICDKYYNRLMNEFRLFEDMKIKECKNNIEGLKDFLNNKRNYIINILNHDKRQKIINELICILANDEVIFDDNPYLFAFNNRIFDLKQNNFIEPKPEYYISLTCGYDWKKTDEIENKKELNRIIDTIFYQPELKNLYLTILSTGLDGLPLEKFVLANGTGGNGKGVINELVDYMLGDYAYVLPAEILLKSLKTDNNPAVANMHNKRLVIAREPDKNLSFNCATIKEITGGTKLNARLNHSNDTKTTLRLTFILECNDKPKLNETNDALSRRILDIPFKSRFVDEYIYNKLDETEKINTHQTNPYYKSQEFKEKFKYALFLLLADYYKLYVVDKKLPITEEIIQRNEAYMAKSDDLLGWFEDNFEPTTDPTHKGIKLKTVYINFQNSEYFKNLNKIQKRQNNYKNFIEKIETNRFLKKFIYNDIHKCYYLKGHNFISNNTIDEEDNDLDK